MDKSIKDKLLSCRSYNDAKPILETNNAGVAAHKLFSTGFSIQAKQAPFAKELFNTAIQEMEDDEENKMKIVKEADGGKSAQSTSTTGLEKVGTESDAAESFHAQADKKDQMGVAINEAFPPQPGMPPQQPAPPMGQPQQMAGGCGGQPPQAPPMQQPQQQMQYTTVQEVLRQGAILSQIQEAIKALDKKIQETQSSISQPSSLEIGSQTGQKSFAQIRETTDDKTINLTKARQDITKMNNFINSGN